MLNLHATHKIIQKKRKICQQFCCRNPKMFNEPFLQHRIKVLKCHFKTVDTNLMRESCSMPWCECSIMSVLVDLFRRIKLFSQKCESLYFSSLLCFLKLLLRLIVWKIWFLKVGNKNFISKTNVLCGT